MDEVKHTRLELKPLSEKATLLGMHALNCEMDADGTRYSLLVIPFTGYVGCGFISQSDAYLVVDGGEKTAFVFKSPPVWSYVHEKLMRGYRQGLGETDAKNTAYLIAKAIEKIKAEAQAELEPDPEEQRKTHEEAVIYHFGEGRLKDEDAEADEDEEDEPEEEKTARREAEESQKGLDDKE